ncbi:MAG: BamA/TamA family outer membrane protein [Acidobacteria bacterium]|nr:BamA/TamA family outer membrane protein [Acidobacteriota bacterium]
MHPLAVRLVTGLAGILLAVQLPSVFGDSRKAGIEASRDQKSQHLEPEDVSGTEKTLLFIKDKKVVERITAGISGFRLKLGGMVTGSGFALGPEYLRRDLADGEVNLRSAAQFSFKNYQKYDLQFTVPSFARDRLFFEFYSAYHRYPGLDYYGPGPDSLEQNRTNFKLEDAALDAAFGVRPFPGFFLGVSGGYLRLNIGPGENDDFPSTEDFFSREEVPGIEREPDFFRFGTFALFDFRDNPAGARSGGVYSLHFDRFSDRSLDRHNFRRVDFEAQQYIPFFNKRRVLALRLRSVLTIHDSDQAVPFYFQPVLGGSDDLRGFPSFRFYDDNLLLANLEYRWEVFSGLDTAIFFDMGKVFPHRTQWNFRNMESSAGFGLRFNVRNSVFLRVDAGFGREGPQVWFKFGDIYKNRPLRFSSPY